jgi:hypothetical protein
MAKVTDSLYTTWKTQKGETRIIPVKRNLGTDGWAELKNHTTVLGTKPCVRLLEVIGKVIRVVGGKHILFSSHTSQLSVSGNVFELHSMCVCRLVIQAKTHDLVPTTVHKLTWKSQVVWPKCQEQGQNRISEATLKGVGGP